MAFFPESKGRLCPTSLFISGAWLSAQHWKVFVALFWKLCYFGTGNKAPGCAVCVLHYCAWPRGRVGLVWAGLKLSLRKGNLPLRRKAQFLFRTHDLFSKQFLIFKRSILVLLEFYICYLRTERWFPGGRREVAKKTNLWISKVKIFFSILEKKRSEGNSSSWDNQNPDLSTRSTHPEKSQIKTP